MLKTAAWTIPKPIYQLGQHTRTRFATNIKIKGENLPSHWSAVQPDSIKREILTIRFPFILTNLYIHVHVAILAAQFLFFFKFLQYPLQMREYQKIRSSEVWRRQNIEENNIFSGFSQAVSWTFLLSSEYSPKYRKKTSCDSDLFSDILGKCWKLERVPSLALC